PACRLAPRNTRGDRPGPGRCPGRFLPGPAQFQQLPVQQVRTVSPGPQSPLLLPHATFHKRPTTIRPRKPTNFCLKARFNLIALHGTVRIEKGESLRLVQAPPDKGSRGGSAFRFGFPSLPQEPEAVAGDREITSGQRADQPPWS